MASTYRRRFGDRKEGRLLRSIPAFNKFIPFIMPQRNDRYVHFEESFEVSQVDRRLRALRVEGYKGIGLLHFFIACHIRAISMLPGINRFVVGRRIYARNNIEIVMTVKRQLSIDATETTIKVVFEPTDTIFDVYRKLNEKIEEIKTSDDSNGTEDFAETVSHLPRFMLRGAIGLLRVMDYYGWIPQSLLDVSPFHGSMIVTDLGAFGPKRHAYELDRNGNVLDRKYVDTKAVVDEGIVDGHYYAQLFQAYQYMFQHPEIVEVPPTKVIEDVF